LAYFLPIILLSHHKYRKTLKGVIFASFSVVIGIFGERLALVIPGAAYPIAFFPGKIEGIWGEAGSFPITPIELFMSIGIFTLMGVFFLSGLKNLELLPVYNSGEDHPKK
jgi:Ni/Fe-hydrogenase subunit HybB-like protein